MSAVREPVFIVGLYKNGTSWLLAALAAHPQFSALRELDVLRSVADCGRRVKLLPPRQRLARVFGKSAFCGLRADMLAPGAFRAYADPSRLPAGVNSLYDLPAELAVEVITAMQVDRIGKDVFQDVPADKPVKQGKPVGFANLPRPLLAKAFTALRDAGDPARAMHGFLDALAPALPPERRLVLKGADQINCFEVLRGYYPDAPKIAIVRDGRDAAVSAYHYRRLMQERGMAWQHGFLAILRPIAALRTALRRSIVALRRLFGYGADWRLGYTLKVWRHRVRLVLQAAERGELYVLRYEDLLEDFEGSFGQLLRWLGADASPETLAAVRQASSFESMSGRPRGVSAKDVVRKGVAREWLTELTARDQALAWRIAGPELTAMGYTRDGHIGPFRAPGPAGRGGSK